MQKVTDVFSLPNRAQKVARGVAGMRIGKRRVAMQKTVQVVIDIPKGFYEYVKRHNDVFNYGLVNGEKIGEIIANGTVLPKHGRLIDADKLIKVTETMYLEGDSPLSFRVDGNTEDTLIGKFQMIDTISDAPTILEATKESSDDCN